MSVKKQQLNYFMVIIPVTTIERNYDIFPVAFYKKNYSCK